MNYSQKLSSRAIKDLDSVDDKTKKRMLDRIAELADVPYDPKLSIKLTNQGGITEVARCRMANHLPG